MPYISSEEVANIRKKIKEKHSDYKFSITKSDHSGIDICVLESDIFKDDEYKQINHFHLNKYDEKEKEFWEDILKIIESVKEQKELVYDGDYGSVPTFYIHLQVGRWDRHHRLTEFKTHSDYLRDNFHIQDNILDGVTYKMLIDTVYHNGPIRDKEAIIKTLKEIIECRLRDCWDMLEINVDNILKEIEE